MPKINVRRYSDKSGTEEAPPVGKEWAGWVEPADKSWIIFLAQDGSVQFYGARDKETGACLNPPVVVRNGAELIQSSHGIGDEVRVQFVILDVPAGNKLSREEQPSFLGKIAAVTFTEYGKVLYDIHVPVDDGTEKDPLSSHKPRYTIIERVDSVFVFGPNVE